MIIEKEKILSTEINFFKKYYSFDDSHHFARETGEHYKLLTYITKQFDGITILDIGTYEGASCLSLAQNLNNNIITYDIEKIELPFLEDYTNVTRKIMDINEETDEIINSAQIIFLDAIHDGTMEKKFSDRLEKLNYKGFLICDDVFSTIHPKCTEWYSTLEIEKYDLTDVGHSHGTGLINYFRDGRVKII